MTEANKTQRGTSTQYLGTLSSIQALRAVAAILVVYLHIFENHTAADLRAGSGIGHNGVDIFFVISGFIMGRSTKNGRVGAFRYFCNRIVRIFPMWWLALYSWIGLRLLYPDRLHNADVTHSSIFFSTFLIPHLHAAYLQIWPILIPGWTLQFELFFYCITTLALSFTLTRAHQATFVTIMVLVAFGFMLKASSPMEVIYTDPLLLEFAGGILIAMLYGRVAVSSKMSLALVIGATFAAAEAQAAPEAWRVLSRGLPALVIVASVLSLESWFIRPGLRWLILLGDASYSLYLFHGFPIAMCAILWSKIFVSPFSYVSKVLFVFMSLASSVLFSLLIYYFVEIKILRLLRRSRRDRLVKNSAVESASL